MREILLKLQGDDLKEFDSGWMWTRGEGFFLESDNYQIDLLEQAGLVQTVEQSMASVVHDQIRLTNSGHDYLDAIADEGVWQKTKKSVLETGGNATLEMVKALASGYLKKKISQHTGIEL